MYILHYSIGFPPYRNGGLVKFCMDLMTYQKNGGHSVGMIWPGKFGLINKKTKIKKSENDGFLSFEIINPLPVSICNGINDYDLFTKAIDMTVFIDFLKKERPDVIHIHTLMGLPKEFLKATKDLGIKTIYTTHDYFGLCPTGHLFYKNKICQNNDFSNCAHCNSNAFSFKKMLLMQSKFYQKFSNSKIMKKIRNILRGNNEKISEEIEITNNCNYERLKKFYTEMFDDIDVIHCNSSISYKVFSHYYSDAKLIKQNITHLDIVDRRLEKKFNESKMLNLLFLGPEVDSKGFSFIIENLDKVYAKKQNFKLYIYSRDNFAERDYIVKNGKYAYSDLPNIYQNIDLLLAPSQWYETFGFIVLEAYNHGTPSLITHNVGSQDILKNNITGFIVDNENFENKILELLENKEIINEMINNIKKEDINISMEEVHRNIYGG